MCPWGHTTQKTGGRHPPATLRCAPLTSPASMASSAPSCRFRQGRGWGYAGRSCSCALLMGIRHSCVGRARQGLSPAWRHHVLEAEVFQPWRSFDVGLFTRWCPQDAASPPVPWCGASGPSTVRYRHRAGNLPRGATSPRTLRLSSPEIAPSSTSPLGPWEVSSCLDPLTASACSWLPERHLCKPGTGAEGTSVMKVI